MNKNSFIWVLIVLVLSVFSFKSLIRPGYFPMHDDMQVIRLVEMDKCFHDGQIPCRWVPDLGYGYGYPLYNYYGPLSYYFMEIFHFVGFSFIDSIKIEIIATFIASALGMFLLGRSLWGNWGGLISSVFYIYAPYRASDVYSRGAVGEFNALIYLPFIFWGILELIKNGRKKYLLIVSLSIAALLTTHNITSLIFLPFVLLWSILLLIYFRKKELMVKVFLSFFLGFCLAGFFILPAVIENPLAHTETMISGYFNYLAHYISVGQIFFNTHWGYGPSELGPYDDLLFNVGIFHWFFAGIAIILAILSRKKEKLAFYLVTFLGVISIFTLFMTHQKSTFIWQMIPILSYLQFPWRFLTISIFFVSLMCGAIVIYTKKFKAAVIILLLGIVIFFNSGYFQPETWYEITDQEKMSGVLWERQVTASIFDYLPIYAKAPPATAAPDKPWSVEGEVKILDYIKGTDWQTAKIEVVSEQAIVRLPQIYFPDFKVSVDGKFVPIDYKNDLGLITFNLDKGNHEVKLKLYNSPIRVIGNMLTIASLCFIVGWIIYDCKNKKNS
jgi:hypothetical protein